MKPLPRAEVSASEILARRPCVVPIRQVVSPRAIVATLTRSYICAFLLFLFSTAWTVPSSVFYAKAYTAPRDG